MESITTLCCVFLIHKDTTELASTSPGHDLRNTHAQRKVINKLLKILKIPKFLKILNTLPKIQNLRILSAKDPEVLEDPEC